MNRASRSSSSRKRDRGQLVNEESESIATVIPQQDPSLGRQDRNSSYFQIQSDEPSSGSHPPANIYLAIPKNKKSQLSDPIKTLKTKKLADPQQSDTNLMQTPVLSTEFEQKQATLLSEAENHSNEAVFSFEQKEIMPLTPSTSSAEALVKNSQNQLEPVFLEEEKTIANVVAPKKPRKTVQALTQGTKASMKIAKKPACGFQELGDVKSSLVSGLSRNKKSATSKCNDKDDEKNIQNQTNTAANIEKNDKLEKAKRRIVFGNLSLPPVVRTLLLDHFGKQFVIDFTPRYFPSRRLHNPNYMCFYNSLLQSLLHCAPFYNMMTQLLTFEAPPNLQDSIFDFFKASLPAVCLIPMEAEFRNRPRKPFFNPQTYYGNLYKNADSSLKNIKLEVNAPAQKKVTDLCDEAFKFFNKSALNDNFADLPMTPLLDAFISFFGLSWYEGLQECLKAAASKSGSRSISNTTLTPQLVYNAMHFSQGLLVPAALHQQDCQEYLMKTFDAINSEIRKVAEFGFARDLEKSLAHLQEGAAVKSIQTSKQMHKQSIMSVLKPNESAKDEAPDESAGVWRKVTKTQKQTQRTAAAQPETPLSKIFGGILRFSTSNAGSKNVSIVDQEMEFLNVSIVNTDVHSLDDALDLFFATECVEGYQSSPGGEARKGMRKAVFAKVPPVLFITLNRHMKDRLGNLTKCAKNIEIPTRLNVSKFVANELRVAAARLSPSLPEGDAKKVLEFKISSIVCHNSKNHSNGHYITYVADYLSQPAKSRPRKRDTAAAKTISEGDNLAANSNDNAAVDQTAIPEPRWIQYNDAAVLDAKKSEVFDPRNSNNAYMIIYENVALSAIDSQNAPAPDQIDGLEIFE